MSIRARISVDTTGIQELETEIRVILTQLNLDIGQMLNTYERTVFDTEGAVNGEKWKPISERTRKVRQKHGVNPDNPILHARGVLSRSYMVYSMDAFPEYRSVLFFPDLIGPWDGANLPVYHHFGHGRRYPKRPLFDVNTVAKWCEDVIRRLQ